MGAKSRRKGKVGEREVATLIRARLPDVDAQRSYHQARDGSEAPDVVAVLMRPLVAFYVRRLMRQERRIRRARLAPRGDG